MGMLAFPSDTHISPYKVKPVLSLHWCVNKLNVVGPILHVQPRNIMTSGFPPFCKKFTHKLHTWDCRPPSHWIQLINDVNILQTVDKARAQQIRVHWNDLKRWTSLRSQRMCIRPATRGPLLSSSRINCYLYFFKLVLGELLSGSVVFVFFKCIFFWAESHQQSCISSETSVTRFVLPASCDRSRTQILCPLWARL